MDALRCELSRMTEEAFQAAWKTGQSPPLADVIEDALGDKAQGDRARRQRAPLERDTNDELTCDDSPCNAGSRAAQSARSLGWLLMWR